MSAERIARVEDGLVPEIRSAGEKGWSIAERLRAHRTPGVSIAVIDGYRVAWARAYGLADADIGTPMQPTTQLQAASVSKLVTAVAALREVEAGKIALDGDVNHWLRSWKLPDNARTGVTKVNLRQLLSHSAGTTVYGFLGYTPGARLPSLLDVLEGKDGGRAVRVDEAPGTAFRYSGGGTMIVEQLLVDVEGKRFADILDETVLGPLHLERSTFNDPSGPVAAAHDFDGRPLVGKRRIYPQLAAAGLWSTPTDLAHLLVEVQLASEGRSRIISRDVASKLTTPFLPIAPDLQMAMGSFVEKHGDAVYFGHDGLAEGFVAVVRASKNRGQGAVVMANGFAATPLTLEILRSIAVEYAWEGWLEQPVNTIPLEPSELWRRAGRYGTSPDGAVFITARDGNLSARRPFEQPVELLPVAKDTCVGRDGARFTFATDGSLTLQSRGSEPSSLQRLPKPTPLELVELGRAKEAIALYRMFPNSDSGRAEAGFDELGMDVAWHQHDAPKAIALYEVATVLHPQSLRLHIGLADAYARAGRGHEARASYARAKELVDRARALSDHDELYVRARFAWLEQRGLGHD